MSFNTELLAVCAALTEARDTRYFLGRYERYHFDIVREKTECSLQLCKRAAQLLYFKDRIDDAENLQELKLVLHDMLEHIV